MVVTEKNGELDIILVPEETNKLHKNNLIYDKNNNITITHNEFTRKDYKGIRKISDYKVFKGKVNLKPIENFTLTLKR